jgi:hypothetical protein
MIHKGYVILAAYQCGSGFWYTQGTEQIRNRVCDVSDRADR